jgi:CheY-like chemotaxis protein
VNRVRILLVEDDALIGVLLGEMLTGMGFAVCAIEATESAAVLAAVQHKPDLIIADATLAQGSGLSAVDRILRTGPVAHLFTSGDGLRVKLAKPAAVVLQKPFDEAALADAIRRALDQVAMVDG